MGKLKRKYGSSSSGESFSDFSSATEGSKTSQLVSSLTSSNLSGLSRNFGRKNFKCGSASENSSNPNSQLSEIVTKYAYAAKKQETSKSKQNNSEKLKAFDEHKDDTSQRFNQKELKAVKELFYHSTPSQSFTDYNFFDDPNYSESIKDHFSQLTEDINISKETSGSEDLEHKSFSLPKQLIAKSEEFEFSQSLYEHFSKDISDLEISECSTEHEDRNSIHNNLFEEIESAHENINSIHEENLELNQNNFSLSKQLDIQQDIDIEYSQKENFFEDYLNDISINSSNKIGENQLEDDFLDQEIFEEIVSAHDDINSIHEENLELNQNNFSLSKQLDIQQDIDKEYSQKEDFFEDYLNDIFINSSNKIGENQLEDDFLDQEIFEEIVSAHDDIHNIHDNNFEKNLKLNDPPQFSENMESNKSSFSFSKHLDNQQDADVECSQREANFEEFLNISISSSKKITKIQLDDTFLKETATISYELEQVLNTSLSSGTLSTGSNLSDSSKRLRAGLNRISKDKSLIYVGPKAVLNDHLANQKKDIIKTEIEETLTWFIRRLTTHEPLGFKVRNNKKWSNCIFVNDVLKLKPHQDCILSETKYANPKRRQTFNLILYLLIKCYILLQENSYSTQREIYYQLKNFLSSQDQIRSAMNTISSMLNIELWYFPIVSTSNGLVFGDLSIIISDKEIIHCNAMGGTLIPQDVTKIREFRSPAFFILVVEKDAIFKKLLEEGIPNKLTRPFIIVTGKGFPGINTRLFIKKLWMCLRVPVFILVDADPHGIDIMLTYRFGSQNMAHLSEELALPHIRWLGVLPSEIGKLKITHQALNDKERSKIKDMLQRPYVNEKPWLKEELEILEQNNYKAEIEGVIKSTAFLTDVYLPFKFYSQDYF